MSFVCDRCNKEFKNASSYAKHLKRKTLCKKADKKVQIEITEEIVTDEIDEIVTDEIVTDENILIIKELLSEIVNDIVNSSSFYQDSDIEICHREGLDYLSTIDDKSVNLILTDPPYIISKESGMNLHHKKMEENKKKGIVIMKTEEQWNKVKGRYIGKKKNMSEEVMKENYLKTGSIYGNKFAVKTDYGDWDKDFDMDTLDKFIEQYYKKLKNGGTLIIFFDLWKITPLSEIMEKYKFKQLRIIEWIKTNPQPRNSKVNYLTNCKEYAILGVKGSNPTFNSKYDNGLYHYPFPGGKDRFHPTQKPVPLFEDLIKKHSNEGDLVLDTFLGSGTTASACKNAGRRFKGCEANKVYYDKTIEKLEKE